MNDFSELYQILEFDKILNLLKERTISSPGKEKFDHLQLMTDLETIQRRLQEVAELRAILEYEKPFPLNFIADVREDLKKAKVPGNYLEPHSLVQIARTLSTAVQIKSYLVQRQNSYPNLYEHAKRIVDCKEIVNAIAAVIDFDNLEIKDDATPRLKHLRKEIHRLENSIRTVMEKWLRLCSQKGYLQEELITFREGRWVLPVKAEHKSRVKGLVHDYSASGATFFIEPLEAVEHHNEMLRMKAEEREEIKKILKEVTSLIRNESSSIENNVSILAHFDFIHAKAIFARDLNCNLPELNANNVIEIIRGRHPLLQLYKGGEEGVTPLDIKIGEGFHTLVITGPNAGGKTVALKTVGLLTLMIQAGIPIPANPDSKMSVFQSIFADIGDYQSIEQDLSTFTSHMQRMNRILNEAGKESLVLIDEIGVGTDPEEGSALAVAILQELTKRGCTTIVTTHLGSLKNFAYQTEGVENGSLEFDIETLQPTYKFRLGIPGSSYAIEIARRMGIPENVLEDAQKLIGREKSQLQELLLDLEKKIYHYKKLIEETDIEKARLEGLVKLYRERYETLKRDQNRLKKEALLESQEILKRANAAVEQAIKEIKEKQAHPKVIKKVKQELSEQRSEIENQLTRVEEQGVEDESGILPEEIQVGQWVYWKKQRIYGMVVSEPDSSGRVMIQSENLKLRVPLSELKFARPGGKKSSKESGTVSLQIAPKSDVLPEIDLRGLTVDEAIPAVDKFLDDAFLAGWQQVRIIHGKGTGRLRKGLTKYLNNHPRVKSKKFAGWNEGDIGVTIVELNE
ncbi:MAG: endonuclease MutS2 [Calditrichaeota bacterium]|nr:MAG: endonuclease MutS2 [Calditrichota bacterium]